MRAFTNWPGRCSRVLPHPHHQGGATVPTQEVASLLPHSRHLSMNERQRAGVFRGFPWCVFQSAFQVETAGGTNLSGGCCLDGPAQTGWSTTAPAGPLGTALPSGSLLTPRVNLSVRTCTDLHESLGLNHLPPSFPFRFSFVVVVGKKRNIPSTFEHNENFFFFSI